MNTTPTGTMMLTTEPSEGIAMKRISIRSTGGDGDLPVAGDIHDTEAAEQGRKDLVESRCEDWGVEHRGKRCDEDHAEHDNERCDDARHADGDGGDDLSLLRLYVRSGKLKRVQRRGSL